MESQALRVVWVWGQLKKSLLIGMKCLHLQTKNHVSSPYPYGDKI